MWKKIIPNNINYHIILYRTIFSLLFSVVIVIGLSFIPFTNNDASSFLEASFNFWVLTLSICFFSFYGLYYFTNALKNGRYSIVTPFISSAAVFSFITSIIIYNEKISIVSYLAFFILIIGLIVHQSKNFKTLQFSKEIYLAILSSFFWGVSFVLYPIPIEKFGIFNFSIILETCVFLSCIYLLIIKEKRIKPRSISKKEISLCFLIGLCVAGGNITANFSLLSMPIYINIIISVLFEATVLVLGIKLFKEKIKKKDWILIIAVTTCSILTFF